MRKRQKGRRRPEGGRKIHSTTRRETGRADNGVTVTLIDEFKIRKQVAGIEASTQPPLRKARLILRLARSLRTAAKSLGKHSQRSFRDGDLLRAARMHEATERLIEAHAEVRAHAGAALVEDHPPDQRT